MTTAEHIKLEFGTLKPGQLRDLLEVRLQAINETLDDLARARNVRLSDLQLEIVRHGERAHAHALAMDADYTLANAITGQERKHGSLRAAARVLKCDPSYLSRLRSGEKLNPSVALLRKLGLRRVVHYVRAPRSDTK